MRPGRELDRLIHSRVMRKRTKSVPRYSTNIADAWKVVEKLAPLVGDFQEADGYFRLLYADSADHSEGEACNPGETVVDDDDNDLERWSCHFHPGYPGAGTESASLFPNYERRCARGETAAHAICRAALLVATWAEK